MSHDQNLKMMNTVRRQTVEAENASTFKALSDVLEKQIALAYEELKNENIKLLNPIEAYNNHQVSLYLKLNLKDFYDQLPQGQYYRIYWQPSHIPSPQAMEVILRPNDHDLVLGNVLTGCTLPVLEEFRQNLRQSYPDASISSHYMGGANPEIRISITYKFDYQKGIPVVLHQKKAIGGGTVWNTEKIQQSN